MSDPSDQIARLNAALEGRYTIERQIGEGGMATVYLATDLRHEREVALKVLKPELAAVVGGERFLAEIKTTANLKHPHILPLFDSGQADSFLFYVMPYVEGESLRDRINRDKQLPVDEAVAIARKVAGALQHAHDHGVIHRDVKPGNILFQDNEPVVTDFGIALAAGVAGGTRLTETGLSVGTPFYMSPEQATGDQGMGPRSDTYSLACVLYEMLIGDPPYQGSTAQAVLGQIIAGDSVSATNKRASIPANVDAAIRKALEKLPADRFTAAQDFAKALTDSGFRHGAEAALAAAGGKGLWNPVSVGASGAAILFAVTAGWSLLRPDPPQPVSRFLLNIPEGVQPVSSNGVGLSLSPDGSRVVFVGQTGGSSQLWQRPLNQLTATPVSGTENARNPRFSPDGESVAFTHGGALSTVSLTGAPPLTVVSDSVNDANGGLAWGPDGMLYFRKTGLGIWRVSANGGEEEEITTFTEGEADHLWLDVLPNGRGILFTRDIGTPLEDEIAVLSLETGEIRVLVLGAMARYAHSGHIVYVGGDGTLYAAPFDQERMEVTGPSRTLLEGVMVLGGSAGYFALSETGTLLYRLGAGASGTTPIWVSRNGAEEVLDPLLTGASRAPAVSPDGRKIAFEHAPAATGQYDIWIYDLDQGGTFSPLTFDGGMFDPFWSPDGSEVGYQWAGDLYARPWDGSGSARLLRRASDGVVQDVVWTPDGRWLVYRTDGATLDLSYAPPHPDSASVVILDTPFNELAPSISPDGRWLAYQSDESGNPEAYVRPFPGPGGRVAVSLEGGYRPIWAQNGREIFYVAADNSRMVATVRTDPEFVVESRESFGSAQGFYFGTGARIFSLAPDDQRLIANRLGAEGDIAQDILVQNFFEELRQVVPAP